MIKVSVILPVYGVAEYIEACTKSLLAQTFDEVEFLFVDDHGPDDSMAILQRTIEGHPRAHQFRVLTPDHNQGAGMARNFCTTRQSHSMPTSAVAICRSASPMDLMETC